MQHHDRGGVGRRSTAYESGAKRGVVKRSNLQRKSRLHPASVRKALRHEQDAIENAGSLIPAETTITPGPTPGTVRLHFRGSSRRRAVSPASREQRLKAKEGCRVHGLACGNADPAHVVARGGGQASGCDAELCTVPLCRELHTVFDAGRFDLSPYLTHAEAAHAVEHLGLFGALRRITGQRWVPENLNVERY